MLLKFCVEIVAEFSATNLAFRLGDCTTAVNSTERRKTEMNFQLASNQKVPYRVTHIDGSLLAPGNTLAVDSADVSSATIVPDAAPAAGSLASGFIVGGAKLAAGLKITTTEKNSAGVVTDTVAIAIDVVGAAAAANLAMALGTAVPQ